MNDQMILEYIEAQIKESKILKIYIYIIYNEIQLFFYIQYNRHYIFLHQIFVPYIYLKSLLTVSNKFEINIIYYNYKHIERIYLTI